MQCNFKLNLKIILLAALTMFAVSMLLSFALLFIIGIVQIGITLNLQIALERASGYRSFNWL